MWWLIVKVRCQCTVLNERSMCGSKKSQTYILLKLSISLPRSDSSVIHIKGFYFSFGCSWLYTKRKLFCTSCSDSMYFIFIRNTYKRIFASCNLYQNTQLIPTLEWMLFCSTTAAQHFFDILIGSAVSCQMKLSFISNTCDHLSIRELQQRKIQKNFTKSI